MGRKSIPPHDRARNSGISLPPKLIDDSVQLAARSGKSLSGLVRELLLKELRRAVKLPAAPAR